MDPILTVLRIGAIERPIGTYGLLLAFGLLVGAVLASRAAWQAKLDVGITIAAMGYTVAGGLAGSYVAFWVVEFLRTGSPMTAIEQPGLVFYGGPLGGGLALYLACRGLGLPFRTLIDVAVHAVPAGHAIGRLGCFFGGCCYGSYWEGPWAIRYTHPIAPASVPPIFRHPTPLYESALLMAFAWTLLLWRPKHVGTGHRAGVYLVGYASIRTVTELFRGDVVRGVYFGMISTSQLISLVLFLAGLAVLWRTRRA
ncbi:MAG: prolipoprotein diacylglyceryl transferase family protein [Myxococcota bacterium]